MAQADRMLDQVRERDLDLMLASALFGSEHFRCVILKHVAQWTGPHELASIHVSETTDAGETDVLFVADLADNGRLAVMIENKIGAAFQPAQAERYRERGEHGVRDGRWGRFLACLCAPESYLAEARLARQWDAYVSLEAICEWADQIGDRHFQFVKAICAQAVAKRALKLREASAEATALWMAYRLLSAQLLPNVVITRLPNFVGPTSPWPEFGANLLPKEVSIEHKPQKGRVDLTFNGCPLDVLRERLPKRLPIDVVPMKTGGSSALSVAVPRIDHVRPFEEQQDEVLAALSAVERLLTLGMAIIS